MVVFHQSMGNIRSPAIITPTHPMIMMMYMLIANLSPQLRQHICPNFTVVLTNSYLTATVTNIANRSRNHKNRAATICRLFESEGEDETIEAYAAKLPTRDNMLTSKYQPLANNKSISGRWSLWIKFYYRIDVTMHF